jgi:hypothetical protein
MRDLASTLLLLALIPTGCGTDVEVVEETLTHQLRWTQQPGEVQDCHVFKLDNTRQVEINRLQVMFAEGSHHVHIYRSTEPVADSVTDCFKGIDWKQWSLLVGAQTKPMDWQLPEGVTIPVEPHQQLLVQVHWLNTTDKPAESTIDLAFHTTEDSREHLGVMFGVNQRVDIAPGQRTRIEHFCQMPQGAKLHAVMGHFHQYGNNYRVTERMPGETTGREIYYAQNEPAFEFKTYFPAHEVAPGAGFQYGCEFFNWTGNPITWGSDTTTQEHCNMTAYFSPADQISELCLLEPSKLQALTPVESDVRAGQDFVFAVELAAPEATDVEVVLKSSDAAALEVPASITIPAGELYGTFYGHTRRPAQVSVSAALNGAIITTDVRVTGLVVSELFYNPATGAQDQLQWVEIANETDVAIDLSGYSVGAGTTDFMRTRLALPMMIPARGCIVVGGPESSPANYSPTFDLTEDLSPNLDLANTQAAGVGLFGTTIGTMSPTMRPIDAVVYSGAITTAAANTTLRGTDGQLAPVWPGSAPGGSLRRVTDTVWAKSSTPTPGNCEVLNAR